MWFHEKHEKEISIYKYKFRKEPFATLETIDLQCDREKMDPMLLLFSASFDMVDRQWHTKNMNIKKQQWKEYIKNSKLTELGFLALSHAKLKILQFFSKK